MEIQENVSIAKYTSWIVGGDARYFALPETIEELKESLIWSSKNNQPLTIIGGGSNVLVPDEGISGLVVCLKKLRKIEVFEEEDQIKIVAEAGVGKNELLKSYLKKKLAPALFLAGLPGDVAGGVVMNAGVAEGFKPREFVEIVEWVEVLRVDSKTHSVSTHRFAKDDLHWVYRHSSGWQPGVISRVGLTWPNEEDPEVLQKVRDANKIRLSKQPLDKPSCGSVFRNPEGHKSAALIDSCGLKGFTIGGAQVSTKHANFIINTGEAKASDIRQLIAHIKQVVLDQKGVQLQEEVVYL